MTSSFLGAFSPNPLKSFPHPSVSSTHGQLMRMSSLHFPSNASSQRSMPGVRSTSNTCFPSPDI